MNKSIKGLITWKRAGPVDWMLLHTAVPRMPYDSAGILERTWLGIKIKHMLILNTLKMLLDWLLI